MNTPYNSPVAFCVKCGQQLSTQDATCPRCNALRQVNAAATNNYAPPPAPQYSSATSSPNYNMNQWQQPEPIVTVGEWMLVMLVMMIPLVNIIMMFVWAFGNDGSKTKANYFKAALIWGAIILVIYIFIVIAFGAAILDWNNFD